MSLTSNNAAIFNAESDAEAEDEHEALERRASMEEALAEYPAHRRRVTLEQEQEACPHDETDHGYCLECGKDCFDDQVAAAEFAADCANDR
jgi:hypothetical protein